MQKGESISVSGFITRRINLAGRTLEEVEQLLGYSKKRLASGVIIAALKRLPNQGEYHLAGYSQVAGHHTDEQYGKDLQTKYDMKQVTKNLHATEWGLSGLKQLIKVMPMIRHSDEMEKDKDKDKDHYYPPGSGIQQWKLIVPFEAVVVDVVKDYPSGRLLI